MKGFVLCSNAWVAINVIGATIGLKFRFWILLKFCHSGILSECRLKPQIFPVFVFYFILFFLFRNLKLVWRLESTVGILRDEFRPSGAEAVLRKPGK